MNPEFIFFGCWNKGFCNNNQLQNGMSMVFNSLKNENPDFYIIAGDNYYPDKPKKDKTKKDKTEKDKTSKIRIYNRENFTSGFECLNKLTSKANTVHVLMGNHDVEEIRELALIPTNSCIVTTEQKKYMDDRQPKFVYKDIIKIVNNTLIVFLNTPLFTSNKNRFIKCTDEILPVSLVGGSPTPDPKLFVDMYLNLKKIEYYKILRVISSQAHNINNIILTGHDPILGSKLKKGKIKSSTLLEEGIDFICDLYEYFPDARKYYFCADMHLYQKGVLTINRHKKAPLYIEQHIVGTGGAELDTCAPSNEIYKHKFVSNSLSASDSTSISYELHSCDSIYGYLKVFVRDALEIIWVPIIPFTNTVRGSLDASNKGEGRGTRKSKRKSKRKPKRKPKRKSKRRNSKRRNSKHKRLK